MLYYGVPKSFFFIYFTHIHEVHKQTHINLQFDRLQYPYIVEEIIGDKLVYLSIFRMILSVDL